MSTSPSWFDQDKFSRLVKKVGPKTPAAQPAAAQAASPPTPPKPLVKEAPLPSENKGEEEPKASVLPPEAQLPPEEEIPAPAPVAAAPAPRAPVVEPPREARLSSRLPKIDLRKPGMDLPPIPPPLRADAGLPVEEKPTAKDDDDTPVLPGAVSRPEISAQKMMTSQPLSLGKKGPATSPMPSKVEAKAEPIRAPEVSDLPSPKAPPMTGTSVSGKLPQRTTSLPALKSLFQFEIPGNAGGTAAKPTAEVPVPKAPLPAFTFSKPEKRPTETLPPVLDDEEDIPTFAGQSDAAQLDDVEDDLTPENLAAEWEKTDELKGGLDKITKERDDALAESEALLKQLRELRESAPSAKPADSAELDFVTRERDEIRSEYIKLREDFEKLKREMQGKPAPASARDEADPKLQKEIDQLRGQLDEKDGEIRHLKLQVDNPPKPEADPELQKEVEKLRKEIENKDREFNLVKAQLDELPEPGNPEADKEIEKLKGDLAEKDKELVALKITAGETDVALNALKEEILGVRNEVKKAQNEASVAQRGLALSQKALQETRDALREASESASKK